MHYRLFQRDDFDELYGVEEICFRPPDRFSRRYMRELTNLSHAATWIAEEGNQIRGFAIVEWSQQDAGMVAYIATIEVLPDFRQQGIGAELVHRLEGSAHAECADIIWLHVDAENTAAIRLYERLGYKNQGSADHFYARNRRAAIYVKRLAQ